MGIDGRKKGMTIEEMRKCKDDHGYSYDTISEQSGVPASTIFKIFTGISKSPRKRTLDAIELGLRKLTGEGTGTFPYGQGKGIRYQAPGHPVTPYVSETALQYGLEDGSLMQRNSRLYITNPDGTHTWLRQGYYTAEDYDSLPESIHAEFIDGYIIEMDAPSVQHQKCVTFLLTRISSYIEETGADCEPGIAPTNVMLFNDESKILEPDILVTCEDSKITSYGIIGAPDFVAEILSKSTKRYDMNLKASLYKKAGVKVYWMIDPDREQVMIHDFEAGDTVSIHTFDEKLTLRLHGNELRIDFTILKKQLDKLNKITEANKDLEQYFRPKLHSS